MNLQQTNKSNRHITNIITMLLKSLDEKENTQNRDKVKQLRKQVQEFEFSFFPDVSILESLTQDIKAL